MDVEELTRAGLAGELESIHSHDVGSEYGLVLGMGQHMWDVLIEFTPLSFWSRCFDLVMKEWIYGLFS